MRGPGQEIRPRHAAAFGGNAGLYLLLVRLKAPTRLRIGALGRRLLPAGWYVYTGSARRGLRQRLERHFARHKRRRWHVDWLTSAPQAEVVGAVLIPLPPHSVRGDGCECVLNRRTGALRQLDAVIPRFGASDCRRGCPAHLWFSFRPLSLLELTGIAPGAAVLIPRPDARR
jgi:Uri superfamily endonuclease